MTLLSVSINWIELISLISETIQPWRNLCGRFARALACSATTSKAAATPWSSRWSAAPSLSVSHSLPPATQSCLSLCFQLNASFQKFKRSSNTHLTFFFSSGLVIWLDSASSTFIQCLNRRVSSASSDLNMLDSMSFGTVSFEELLGHCNEVYKKNQADLVSLEDRLKSFGYIPGNSHSYILSYDIPMWSDFIDCNGLNLLLSFSLFLLIFELRSWDWWRGR